MSEKIKYFTFGDLLDLDREKTAQKNKNQEKIIESKKEETVKEENTFTDKVPLPIVETPSTKNIPIPEKSTESPLPITKNFAQDQVDLNRDQPDLDRDRDLQKPISNSENDQKNNKYPGNKYPGNKVPGYSTPVLYYTGVINTPVPEEETTNPSNKYPGNKYRGYFIPNWVEDEVSPTLQLSEQAVYRRLIRLSLGFNRNMTDGVGVTALASKCNLSEKAVKLAIKVLEERRLIKVHRDLSGNPKGGNRYEIITPVIITEDNYYPGNQYPSNNYSGNQYTGVISTPINDHDHEILKEQDLVKSVNPHLDETQKIYTGLTGNVWSEGDTRTYQKIMNIPLAQIVDAIKSVLSRAPRKPGSLAYFVKEILNPSQTNLANKQKIKEKLNKIINNVRELQVGASFSIADLEEHVRRICEKEGSHFDKQIFNELVTKQ